MSDVEASKPKSHRGAGGVFLLSLLGGAIAGGVMLKLLDGSFAREEAGFAIGEALGAAAVIWIVGLIAYLIARKPAAGRSGRLSAIIASAVVFVLSVVSTLGSMGAS